MAWVSICFNDGSVTQMTTTETAGVIAKSHWNSPAAANTGTGVSLLDESGSSTGFSLAWSCAGTSNMFLADSAGNVRMMNGCIDTPTEGSSTVTLTSLAAGLYDFILYCDGYTDATQTRVYGYTFTGTSVTSTLVQVTDAQTNFSGSFVDGTNGTGNYLRVQLAITSDLTVTAQGISGTSPGGPVSLRCPINGIQFQKNSAVSHSLALLLCGN